MLDAAILTALVAAVIGCAIAAYRYPLTAALLCCVALAAQVHYYPASWHGAASGAGWLAAFVVCYQLGNQTTMPRALLGVGCLVTCWLLAGGFEPFPALFAFGPCAVGVLVRSRIAARDELEEKGRELTREQERLAAESVRYERTRIARELHDIVAHCVSVMVVQANAGQYLLTQDPGLAAGALDAIAESAMLAEAEISRLVAMLDRTPDEASRSIDDLVRRARATGLVVRYRLVGDCDALSTAVFDVAYRVVQEAVTNALKHAPGAPIDVALSCSGFGLCVAVSNGEPVAAALGLAAAGGGHGIAGMRERIAACGGSMMAGPAPGGGWRVVAELPTEVSATHSS